jgi:hypothetical protein
METQADRDVYIAKARKQARSLMQQCGYEQVEVTTGGDEAAAKAAARWDKEHAAMPQTDGVTRLVVEIERGPDAGPEECGGCGNFGCNSSASLTCGLFLVNLRREGQAWFRCPACLAAQASYDALAATREQVPAGRNLLALLDELSERVSQQELANPLDDAHRARMLLYDRIAERIAWARELDASQEQVPDGIVVGERVSEIIDKCDRYLETYPEHYGSSTPFGGRLAVYRELRAALAADAEAAKEATR